MPSTFKIKDALNLLGSRPPLGVNDNGVHAFECLRLLTGTVNLEHKVTGKVSTLRFCHLTQQKRKLKRNTISEVISNAFDGDLTEGDLSSYLERTKATNRGYWESLRAELCLALAADYSENYTEAFLHIYRILEMSSVALPLFYATAEYDYRKALDFLKELPGSQKDGDLAILKKFSTIIARTGGYTRYTIEIPYSKGDFAWDDRYAEQIEKYVLGTGSLRSVVDTAGRKIDVPFEEVPSFIISFRNRLFHNALSMGNFDLDYLGGPSRVCEPLIKPSLNWVTLVLCAIIQQSIARYT